MRYLSRAGMMMLMLWGLLMSATPAQALELKIHWKKGQLFKIYWFVEQDIDQIAMGRKTQVKQTIGTGYAFKTKSVNASGVAQVSVTFKRVYFKVITAGRRFVYDSLKPPKKIPPVARGFAALLNRGFTMHIDPLGRVQKITGANKMLDSVIGTLKVGSPAMRAQMTRQLKLQFGDKALRQMMEQMMAIYPDKPVKVGESWTKTLRMGGAVPMTLKRTWTLVAKRGPFAFLKVYADVLPNKKSKPLAMGPLKLRYNLRGTQKGTMFIQLKSGFPMRGRSKQFLKGKIKVKGNLPNMPKNMTWPVKINTTIQFKPFK